MMADVSKLMMLGDSIEGDSTIGFQPFADSQKARWIPATRKMYDPILSDHDDLTFVDDDDMTKDDYSSK